MSRELIPKKSVDLNVPEHEQATDCLAFAQRIANEPALRYQLSQLLQTIHIDPYKKDSVYGYTQHPIIEHDIALHHMNLGDLTGEDRHRATRIVLGTAIETRDELLAARNGNEGSYSESVLNKLPFELQIVALARSFARDTSGAFHPTELFEDMKCQTILTDYLGDKLDFSAAEIDATRDSILRIHGVTIAGSYLDFAKYDRDIPETDGLPVHLIRGLAAPKQGLYLPDMINAAVRELYYPDSWMAQYPDRVGKVVAMTNKLGEIIVSLCDYDQGSSAYWGAYALTSKMCEESFVVRREGFSGEYDQLVAWQEPVKDENFYAQFKYVRESLTNLIKHPDFDEQGAALALVAFVQTTGRTLERELVYGASQGRSGRISTLVGIYRFLEPYYPPEELHSLFQDSLPIIFSHFEEALDPWAYQFRQ